METTVRRKVILDIMNQIEPVERVVKDDSPRYHYDLLFTEEESELFQQIMAKALLDTYPNLEHN